MIIVIHTNPNYSGSAATEAATIPTVFDPAIQNFVEKLDDEVEKYPNVINVDNYYDMNQTMHQHYYELVYSSLLENIKEIHEDYNTTQSFYEIDEDELDEMFNKLAEYFSDQFNMDADEIKEYMYDIYELKFKFQHVDDEDFLALANNYTDEWDLEPHHFSSNYTYYYTYLNANHSIFDFNQYPMLTNETNASGYGFYNLTLPTLLSITSDTVYRDPVLMMAESDLIFFVYTYYGIYWALEEFDMFNSSKYVQDPSDPNTAVALSEIASVLPAELDPETNVFAVFSLGASAGSPHTGIPIVTDILADSSAGMVKRGLRDDIRTYYNLFDKEMNYFDLSEDFVDMLFDALGSDLDDFESDLMRDIYDLGPNPMDDDFAKLTEEKTKEFIEDNPLSESQMEEVLANFVSDDNDTMLVFINLDTSGSSKETKHTIEQLREDIPKLKNEVLSKQTNDTALRTEIIDFEVYLTGEGAIEKDVNEAHEKDAHLIDIVSIVLILIILMIVFRSPIAAVLPLIAMFLAIIVSRGLLFMLSTLGIQIHFYALSFMTPILMGVGADYSIFIISRFFEELKSGKDKKRAIMKTLGTAGKTIASSGMTVMIGFSSMIPTKFAILSIIGVSVLIGVSMALISALTFLPSILLILGNRIFWPRKTIPYHTKESNPSSSKKRGFIKKISHIVVRRPKLVLILILSVSIPIVVQTIFIDLSYDAIHNLPPSDSKDGYEILAEEFGEGEIQPLSVVIRFKNGTNVWNTTLLEEIGTIADHIEGMNGTEKVMSVKKPLGTQTIKYLKFEKNETARAFMESYISEDNDTTYIQVFLEREPYSNEAMDLAKQIKEYLVSYQANSIALGNNQCEIYLGGPSQANVEMDKLLWKDFYTVMLPITFIGIFVVLLVLLLSIPTPLRLIGTILLSVLMILGLTTLVFSRVLGHPIDFTLPFVIFVVLMGLGMDYDIFLVSRMRELVNEGKDDQTAIVEALEKTGTIITACGVVMAAAFGSMMLASTISMQMFGFALAIAIILDATIVRLFLVPSVMLLAGKWNWWPPKLAELIESKFGKIEH